MRLLLVLFLAGFLAATVQAQHVPLADSSAFLALSEDQRASFEAQRVGLNLQRRTLAPWLAADAAALEDRTWQPFVGQRRVSELDVYRMAGMQAEAARVVQRNRAASRNQQIALGVAGAGAALLLVGVAPYFGERVPAEGTGSADPNIPTLFERQPVNLGLIAAGSGVLVAGGVTFVLNGQRKRTRLVPMRDVLPGLGAYNSALADDIRSR